MGRKKKGVVAVENVEVVAPTVVAETKPAKKEPYSLHAWFSYIDKEGFKVKSEYKSEGDTVKELLAGVEFPAGVNRLVNVTVKHGANEFTKALAPHKARAILESKSEFEFGNAFRGI